MQCLIKITKGRKRLKDKNKNKEQEQQIKIDMIGINPIISKVILIISGLNTPIKDRLSELIKKQGPTLYCPQETHFKYNDTYRLKINE